MPDCIADLAARAHPQGLSSDHAAARFVGIAHEDSPGTLSLVFQALHRRRTTRPDGTRDPVLNLTD